jgi:hypothetical protein
MKVIEKIKSLIKTDCSLVIGCIVARLRSNSNRSSEKLYITRAKLQKIKDKKCPILSQYNTKWGLCQPQRQKT